MADEAAYLVDLLLPESAYRQWTVTFPWPIRYLMAKDYKLITAILTVVIQCLLAYQRKLARRAGHRAAKPAAVSFVHRAGRVLNSHVHFHALVPDGVFVLDQSGTALRLLALPTPTEADILALAQKIARRVTVLCQKRFATLDDMEQDVLEGAIGEAMRALPIPPVADDVIEDDVPEGLPARLKTSKRCASVDGFSVHAGTVVAAGNRLGLEKLCRYGMRPPFSQERLSLTENGDVLLTLQKPWPGKGGVTALRFDPVTFLRRLSPLIPTPEAECTLFDTP